MIFPRYQCIAPGWYRDGFDPVFTDGYKTAENSNSRQSSSHSRIVKALDVVKNIRFCYSHGSARRAQMEIFLTRE